MLQAAGYGATIGFTTTFAVTGNLTQSVESGLFSALTAGVASGIADKVKGFKYSQLRTDITLVAAQSVTHGLISEVRGGSFKQGALSTLEKDNRDIHVKRNSAVNF